MQTFSRRQLVLLVLLTVVWGVNWPVMKLGVSAYPPLSFRSWSIWLGLPVLAAAMLAMRVPFSVPRRHWGQLLWLATTNMFIWHVCIIVALASLSSGRAAILGYTMPIFSALAGAVFFAAPLAGRGWLGVGAAALGVLLLLWHELTQLAGRPFAVLLALVGAASWAVGTQLLRRTRIDRPTLTIAFWMTAMTAVVMTGAAFIGERDRWTWPPASVWWPTLYNAVMIFGFAHATWYWLARTLPPLASTLSVMFIPVLGVFTGAWWLGEPLHWQDWAAVALIVVAIGSVLWPTRGGRS